LLKDVLHIQDPRAIVMFIELCNHRCGGRHIRRRAVQV
jgi:hypothetical protein